MKERIIGQDDAVDAVSSALARARCGLKDPGRPIAALLFVGPTGVSSARPAEAAWPTPAKRRPARAVRQLCDRGVACAPPPSSAAVLRPFSQRRSGSMGAGGEERADQGAGGAVRVGLPSAMPQAPCRGQGPCISSFFLCVCHIVSCHGRLRGARFLRSSRGILLEPTGQTSYSPASSQFAIISSIDS